MASQRVNGMDVDLYVVLTCWWELDVFPGMWASVTKGPGPSSASEGNFWAWT